MDGNLTGLRVVELADELAEYCGLLLAGLGAEVIKVEPPGGSSTRRIGPFFQDVVDRERSLFFWSYNRGKRSVMLDLATEADRAELWRLVSSSAVLLHSSTTGLFDRLGVSTEGLLRSCPGLVVASMSPFGAGRSVAALQGLRPRPPRPWRAHDELRLRPSP